MLRVQLNYWYGKCFFKILNDKYNFPFFFFKILVVLPLRKLCKLFRYIMIFPKFNHYKCLIEHIWQIDMPKDIGFFFVGIYFAKNVWLMFIIVTWQVLRAPKTRVIFFIHNSLWKLMYWFKKLITKSSWIYPLGQIAKDLIPKWPQS